MWFEIKRLERKLVGLTFKDMQKDLSRLLAENNELRVELRLARGGAKLEEQVERLTRILDSEESNESYF